MATESLLIIANQPSISVGEPSGAVNQRRAPANSRPAGLSDYWTLTKPEVNFLIAIATLTGFYLAFHVTSISFLCYCWFTLFSGLYW